jgi:nanoRNase/pAp phosphatase (c-di-AMP/oligoRNAs hydrolase)
MSSEIQEATHSSSSNHEESASSETPAAPVSVSVDVPENISDSPISLKLKTDLWSSDHNETYTQVITEDLSPLPDYASSQIPITTQMDALLPPESLSEELSATMVEIELPNVEAANEQALDRRLYEESQKVLDPLLNSHPISEVPAEDVQSKSPPAKAPELGLDAIGEAGSTHTSHISHAPPPREEREDVSLLVVDSRGSQPISIHTENSLAPTASPEIPSIYTPIVAEVNSSHPPVVAEVASSNPPVIIEEIVEEPEKFKLEIASHLKPLPTKRVDKIELFVNTLLEAQGSNVLIVIKGHPDPDSIGSAVAQQYCFKHFGIQSSIIYFDEISHPENRALVKVIEMDLIPYRSDFDFSSFDYLAFVDSQSCDLPVNLDHDPPPILTFVDHHKDTGKVDSRFIDIREDAGSTSSIYAEYFEYIPELSLQKSLATHAHIATALMHGIRTDTDNLMLAVSSDFHAAAYLRQFIDRDLLRMVSKQSVTARTMEIIKQGLNNKAIRGTFLLAGVGFVREEDRDGIAQTADFLLRHEGVETAVVFGIVNNNIVDGSLRTSSATVDPDRWLKELFGEDSTGKPYGGGRRNKGGFRIPLGLLAFSPDRKALWKLGEQTIHDLIFDKIGEKEGEKEER